MASEAETIFLTQYIDGPPLAGIFMNVMLYGVMLTQTFFYFSTYKRDHMWIRCYVGILFFSDTLNSIFNMWWVYNVLVNNFGNLKAVTVANWLFETEEAMAGVIAMQVQLFYAWRLHKLGANKWTVIGICALSVIGCLAAIGTAINIAIKPIITNFVHYKEIVLIWLITSTVTDVSIAAAITWQLRKSRTGYSHTDTVISKVIHITMSNGLLTATFALADIIAFVSTTGGLHLAFNYALVKLYGNSVMTTLNSRAILASSADDPAMFKATSSGKQSVDANTFMAKTTISGISRPAQVVVNVETHEMVDVPGRHVKSDLEWNDDSSIVRSSDTKSGVVI